MSCTLVKKLFLRRGFFMSLFVLDNKNISKAIHLLHPNKELFEIR